jgi:hypothetical protein
MRHLISLQTGMINIYSASCGEQISTVDFHILNDTLIFEVRTVFLTAGNIVHN